MYSVINLKRLIFFFAVSLYMLIIPTHLYIESAIKTEIQKPVIQTVRDLRPFYKESFESDKTLKAYDYPLTSEGWLMYNLEFIKACNKQLDELCACDKATLKLSRSTRDLWFETVQMAISTVKEHCDTVVDDTAKLSDSSKVYYKDELKELSKEMRRTHYLIGELQNRVKELGIVEQSKVIL